MIDVLINSMGSTLSQCVCYQITTLYTSNLTVLLVIYASIKLKEKKNYPRIYFIYLRTVSLSSTHKQAITKENKQV